jgi:carbonic anhydrase
MLQSFHPGRGIKMNRRNLLKALAGLAACPICTTTGFAAEGAHWGYEGAGGPAKWGDLDAANKACSLGGQQSPINIVSPHQVAASGAETLMEQDGRYHRQQRTPSSSISPRAQR